MARLDLTVLTGVLTGTVYHVTGAGATMGRSRVADLHLEDASLSRLHCRLICEAGGVRVQDLGSSNGTSVNGKPVGSEPCVLHTGDVLTAGEMVFRAEVLEAEPQAQSSIDGESKSVSPVDVADLPSGSQSALETDPAGGTVDLGLNPVSSFVPGKSRGPLFGLLLGVAAVLLVATGAIWIFAMGHQAQPSRIPRQLPMPAEQPLEFRYERLEISPTTLFRYVLAYDHAGILTLSIDDLGDADRSFTKRKELTARAGETLRKEFLDANYDQIPVMYPERSADGVSLHRKRLTVTLGASVWERVAENVNVKAFDRLCERLEIFGRNELGAWATQYSVSELRAMGEEQLSLARRYWEQRDLGDEKVYAAVSAYRKGLSALETLNPKPAFMKDLAEGLQTAEALLAERYEAASFAVDQALNTQRYEDAAEMLRKILRMIPDRDDERNVKATEKLLSVENRFLKRGGRS